MTHLTDNFTLEEMTASQTAARKGIRNIPDAEAVKALKALCVNVLEPVRAHFGRPVIVTSGYRSPRLNTAIGGSATSDHCKGFAADFTVHGIDNMTVAQFLLKKLVYKQLILEFPPSGWVHCSYDPRNLKNEELTAKKRGGRTVYLAGLVV